VTNQSIKSAFERFWQHVIIKLDKYATIENLDTHLADKSNPHNVTKTQIGLGNVDNIADADKNVKHAISSDSTVMATQDASGNIITSTYETKADAVGKLESSKTYTDNAVSQKTQVQLITWGADD
jgi:hypothetical protein